MMWTLQELLKWANHHLAEVNNKWVPARPLQIVGLYGLELRVKAAWAVLVGRADAFTWPEGQ